MKDEIIIYQANEASTRIEVRIEEESVWLTHAQMVLLFDSTKQNISLHINNIFKEKELLYDSTVKEYLTVQQEGNRLVKRKLTIFNLDVIISVGYRIKSQRGTQFRIWATQILKDYLLKRNIDNYRVDNLEKDMTFVKTKLNEIDIQLQTNLPPKQGIFFNGQIFDAYVFLTDLFRKAKESIIIIDNYIDESVLLMLAKREKGVKVEIYTAFLTKETKLDLKKYRSQYPDIKINEFSKSHDRFIIIDKKTVYHLGSSLKDLGKKWFAFSILNFEAQDIIRKLNENSNE